MYKLISVNTTVWEVALPYVVWEFRGEGQPHLSIVVYANAGVVVIPDTLSDLATTPVLALLIERTKDILAAMNAWQEGINQKMADAEIQTAQMLDADDWDMVTDDTGTE